jgi:hypothetical protein
MPRSISAVVFALLTSVLAASLALAEGPGNVTGTGTYLHQSTTIDGKSGGFCGMCAIEIDDQPAAAFGLYQLPGAKPQYTFLILFKLPKQEAGMGTSGEGTSEIDTNGNIKCDFALRAEIGKQGIDVGLQFQRDPMTVKQHVVKIGGKEYGQDGPHVFLVDLTAAKPTPIPIKVMPTAAPDFGDKDEWGRQILAAKKELIEKSPEAAKFFGKQ